MSTSTNLSTEGRKEKWLLARPFIIPPNTDIKIGNIISEYDSPQLPIMCVSEMDLPPVHTVTKTNKELGFCVEQGGNLSIGASILQFLRITSKVDISRFDLERYSTKSLKLHSVNGPIGESVLGTIGRDELVRRYMGYPVFHKSAYLIDGVAIARELREFQETNRAEAVDAGTIAPLSTEIGAEADITASHATMKKSSGQIVEDVVFAYRVREICPKLTGGVRKIRSFKAGGVFLGEREKNPREQDDTLMTLPFNLDPSMYGEGVVEKVEVLSEDGCALFQVVSAKEN